MAGDVGSQSSATAFIEPLACLCSLPCQHRSASAPGRLRQQLREGSPSKEPISSSADDARRGPRIDGLSGGRLAHNGGDGPLRWILREGLFRAGDATFCFGLMRHSRPAAVAIPRLSCGVSRASTGACLVSLTRFPYALPSDGAGAVGSAVDPRMIVFQAHREHPAAGLIRTEEQPIADNCISRRR